MSLWRSCSKRTLPSSWRKCHFCQPCLTQTSFNSSEFSKLKKDSLWWLIISFANEFFWHFWHYSKFSFIFLTLLALFQILTLFIYLWHFGHYSNFSFIFDTSDIWTVKSVKPPQVMEFVKRGSLLRFLQDKGDQLKPRDLLTITLGACKGMVYLQSKNIVHRDLVGAPRKIFPEKEKWESVFWILDIFICPKLQTSFRRYFFFFYKIFQFGSMSRFGKT